GFRFPLHHHGPPGNPCIPRPLLGTSHGRPGTSRPCSQSFPHGRLSVPRRPFLPGSPPPQARETAAASWEGTPVQPAAAEGSHDRPPHACSTARNCGSGKGLRRTAAAPAVLASCSSCCKQRLVIRTTAARLCHSVLRMRVAVSPSMMG